MTVVVKKKPVVVDCRDCFCSNQRGNGNKHNVTRG
jgi:hypothetical protein